MVSKVFGCSNFMLVFVPVWRGGVWLELDLVIIIIICYARCLSFPVIQVHNINEPLAAWQDRTRTFSLSPEMERWHRILVGGVSDEWMRLRFAFDLQINTLGRYSTLPVSTPRVPPSLNRLPHRTRLLSLQSKSKGNDHTEYM